MILPYALPLRYTNPMVFLCFKSIFLILVLTLSIHIIVSYCMFFFNDKHKRKLRLCKLFIRKIRENHIYWLICLSDICSLHSLQFGHIAIAIVFSLRFFHFQFHLYHFQKFFHSAFLRHSFYDSCIMIFYILDYFKEIL